MTQNIDPSVMQQQDERAVTLTEIEATRERLSAARVNGQSVDVGYEVEASVLSLMADMQRQLIAYTDMLAMGQQGIAERVEEMEGGTQIDPEDADVILGFVEDATELLKEMRSLVSQKFKDRIDAIIKAGEEVVDIVESASTDAGDESEDEGSDEGEDEGR